MNDIFPTLTNLRPSTISYRRLGVSVAVHCCVLILLAWSVSQVKQGTTATEVRSVGLAVTLRMPDRTRYLTADSTIDKPDPRPEEVTETTAQPESTAAAAPPVDLSAPFELDEALAEMLGTEIRGAAGIGAELRPLGSAARGTETGVRGALRLPDGKSLDEQPDDVLIPGRATAKMGGGTTSTEIFGITGTGRSFIYVFDHSESMKAAGSAPLRASKSELIRSLDSLTQHQQFQIIFYNDRADMFRPHGDRTGLVLAEEGTIARAKAFVRNAQAIGGTEHEAALKLAIGMGADVIFFLTDAEIQTLSESQIDEISRRAQDSGTVIHAIQFGTGAAPGRTFLQRLARRNRGGYRYVDVLSLP